MFHQIAQLLLLGYMCMLFGCSSQIESKPYLKTFDHILTDQYVWFYGQGGIYWVSNEHVVLEANVKNAQGILDSGLYQVNVRDGSYLKVVDVPEERPFYYTYCFDGSVLTVMTGKGLLNLENKPEHYSVVIRERRKKTKSNSYSSFRCEFVENPTANAGYAALRDGDGYLKYERSGQDRRHVFLADKEGKNLKKLIEQNIVRKGPLGMFSIKYFLEDEGAYFGYSPWNKNNCTELWWLYLANWKYTNQKLCLTDWAFGSRLLHRLSDAFYVEHHTDQKGKPKSYVIYKENELAIEMDNVRGSSVSPNGCLVAFGVGNNAKGKSGVRQKLKLFDYCEYKKKELLI